MEQAYQDQTYVIEGDMILLVILYFMFWLTVDCLASWLFRGWPFLLVLLILKVQEL